MSDQRPVTSEQELSIRRATRRVLWALSNTKLPARQCRVGRDCCLTAEGTLSDFREVNGAFKGVPVPLPERFREVLGQLETSAAPLAIELVKGALHEVESTLWSLQLDIEFGVPAEADRSGHRPAPPSLTLPEVHGLATSALMRLQGTGRRSSVSLSEARELFSALAGSRKFVRLPELYVKAVTNVNLAVASGDSHVRAEPVRKGLQALIAALVSATRENQS